MPKSAQFILAITEALKLSPRTCKVVIEADVRKPLMIYVVQFAEDGSEETIAHALRDVLVDDRGQVTVVR